MKKSIVLLLCGIIVISFVSCNNLKSENIKNYDTIEFLNKNNVETKTENLELLTDKAITKGYFIETTPQKAVSIEIPIFDANTDTNQFIYNSVISHLKDVCTAEFNLESSVVDIETKAVGCYDYFVDVDYEITYCSSNLVSIIFSGFFNKLNSAHPSLLCFTLNFDPKSNERIYFKDIYLIDESFYDILVNESMDKLKNAIKDQYFNTDFFNTSIIDCEAFINGLMKEESLFAAYYPDSVGIIIPVSSAMGYFFEVKLPYDLLVNYKYSTNTHYIP